MTNFKAIGAGVAVLAAAVVVGVPTANYLNAKSIVDDCNSGSVEVCEEVIDERNDLRSELSEAGQAVITNIEDQRLRLGLGLDHNNSRIINSRGVLSSDLPFTATHNAQNGTVQTSVLWRDGVRVVYYFQSGGGGYYYQEGITREVNTSLNWVYVDDNVRVTTNQGSVTFLGGISGEVRSAMGFAEANARDFARQQRDRQAQERADMIRRETAVENVIRGVFSPFRF